MSTLREGRHQLWIATKPVRDPDAAFGRRAGLCGQSQNLHRRDRRAGLQLQHLARSVHFSAAAGDRRPEDFARSAHSRHGWNGSFGTIITPNNRLKLGFAYKTKTSVEPHGDANGNAAAQFATIGALFRPDFHYNAEVDTKFPQAFSGGVSWRAHRYATLSFQGDWINWHDAFDRLPVKLTNGNNADINSFVGSNAMNDEIALQWRNQGVFGLGVESPVGEHIAFRGGYSYATNPVP